MKANSDLYNLSPRRAISHFQGNSLGPASSYLISGSRNHNNSILDTSTTVSIIDSSRPPRQGKSMNFFIKKGEAERIDKENSILAKRLENIGSSPENNHIQLAKQFRGVKKIRNQITGTSARLLDPDKLLGRAALHIKRPSLPQPYSSRYTKYTESHNRKSSLPPLSHDF